MRIVEKRLKEQIGSSKAIEKVPWLKRKWNEFIKDSIEEIVSKGGEYVPDELAELRIKNHCSVCPDHIPSEVIPFCEDLTCRNCGCLTSIKSKFKYHFDMSELKVVQTTCLHPDGNKWGETDKNFYQGLQNKKK